MTLTRIFTLKVRILLLGVATLLFLGGLSLLLYKTFRSESYGARLIQTSEMTDFGMAYLTNQAARVSAGEISLDQAQAEAIAFFSAARYGETGYFFLFDEDLRMVSHGAQPELNGQDVSGSRDAEGRPLYRDLLAVAQSAPEGGSYTYSFPVPGSEVIEQKLSHATFFAPWGWAIGTGSYLSDFQEQLAYFRLVAIEVTLAAVVLVGLLSIGVGLSVTRPLARLGERLAGLGEGDETSPVPGTRRGDELGRIARDVEQLRDRLAEARAHRVQTEASQARSAAEQQAMVDALKVGLSALSSGNLGHRLEEAFAPDYETVREDFNEAMSRLQELLDDVNARASDIATTVSELAQGADELCQRTETQAASLEETAAAAAELATQTTQAAQSAAQARDFAVSTHDQAERSSALVGRTVDAMGRIRSSSDEIVQIIGVIDDIAFQTNLLALNAGVEAARAGEAGSGFAVVASEVRSLAQRASEAAHRIKDLITDSAAHVQNGVNLVGETGTALKEIVSMVGKVSALASEIANTATQQSSGISEINATVSQLDMVTQQNAAMVEESTAASHSLRTSASELRKVTSRFSAGTERALIASRAA